MTEEQLGVRDFITIELESRMRWTLARLGQLINHGREVGWLRGDRIPDVEDSESVLDETPATSLTPMGLLTARLGLSNAEVDALWMLACIELDPTLSSAAQHLIAPGMNGLSVQIIERLAAIGSHPLDSKAIGKLVAAGLVETTSDPALPLFRRQVRPTDRVLELARGDLELDTELCSVATLESALAARRASSSETVAPALRHALHADSNAFVVACGVEGSGRTSSLRHAIASTGRSILTIRARDLAKDSTGLLRQLRAIKRECQLHGAWPILCSLEELADASAVVQRELLDAYDGPVFATAGEPTTWPSSRTMVTLRIGLPDRARRVALWSHAMPAASADTIEAAAERYPIAPGLLKRAAASANALASTPSGVTLDDVHVALRSQLERRLLGLAQRIEVRQTWDDLVLPVEEFDLLVEMVARVRHRRHVLDTWGFANKVGKGLGLSALLSGPPGTGKTMIAGLVARELGLDLYQVDLSRVVSKFIGETEKQLAALFEAAESGHAILLFDEADSLFGKRTEVKSSNDRYANLEVNYLLQRMEAFNGISLLTTNHETAIDKAFQRRLAFHIRVPMPDEQQRAMMWKTMIPERAERADDLEVHGLATEFVMSGGYIKNAVLRAAYLAADAATPITTAHLWRAARAEYEAMGKVAHHSAS